MESRERCGAGETEEVLVPPPEPICVSSLSSSISLPGEAIAPAKETPGEKPFNEFCVVNFDVARATISVKSNANAKFLCHVLLLK